ncbi:hypothetical protein JMJ77_0001221, partial [Colletotrichum scovillei]
GVFQLGGDFHYCAVVWPLSCWPCGNLTRWATPANCLTARFLSVVGACMDCFSDVTECDCRFRQAGRGSYRACVPLSDLLHWRTIWRYKR